MGEVVLSHLGWRWSAGVMDPMRAIGLLLGLMLKLVVLDIKKAAVDGAGILAGILNGSNSL